jgi:hypothetical protein
MEDRLGLEKPTVPVKSRRPTPSKPILKHRSLSDILSFPGPNSPPLDGLTFSDDSSCSDEVPAVPAHRPRFLHTTSDSHVHQVNMAAHPRSASPEQSVIMQRTASVRTQGQGQGPFNRKHISFNHFVEQCIAVDSDEGAGVRRRFMIQSESSDEEDDEEDVLTFRSSPRTTSFAVSALSEREPHTIVKLAPTTLKSSEVLPAPSPAVFYGGFPSPGAGPTPTYYASTPQRYSSRWVEEDEAEQYAMGFDYFSGGAADLGIGDEYATPRAEQAHTTVPTPPATPTEPPRSILKNRVPSVTVVDAPATPTAAPPPDHTPRGRSLSRTSSSSSLDRTTRRSSSTSLSPVAMENSNSAKADTGRGRSVNVRTVEAYHPSSSLSPVARSLQPSPNSARSGSENSTEPKKASGLAKEEVRIPAPVVSENERPSLVGRAEPTVSVCTEVHPKSPAPATSNSSTKARQARQATNSQGSPRLNESESSTQPVSPGTPVVAAAASPSTSAAHRALLKNSPRRSSSMDSRRSTNDDYRFAYPGDEGNLAFKPTDIVDAAKVFVDAIWNAGTGVLWGRPTRSSGSSAPP